MTHPYPPHDKRLPYTGKHRWFLTFRTHSSQQLFVSNDSIAAALEQIRRAGRQCAMAIIAYCFMPDHLHLAIGGCDVSADCKAFIKLAKQYSAFYFKRQFGCALWARYGYERVIRDDRELAFVIGYIAANPVRGGLVRHPTAYPYLGSDVHTVEDLLAISEYAARLAPDIAVLPPEGGSYGDREG